LTKDHIRKGQKDVIAGDRVPSITNIHIHPNTAHLDDGVLREGNTRSVGDDVLVETDN